MLYTIAAILLALWIVGSLTAFTAGGLIHLLLVGAIIVLIYQLVTGRRVP
ncbi:lmo0937 family membrane protein [Ideonella sp. DXS29W]|uniref:Lmo0937 family membrane protein n=1 Tax=Ideonella lacteola TaxID=2984193 RepID=A0ABU9BQF2_9BURK